MEESVKPIENGRDNKGKFVKGNPGGGRKPIPPEIKKMFESSCVDAVELLVKTMLDEETKMDIRIDCATQILDRGIGKAVQQNINENINHTVLDETTEETRERLLQLLESLRK
jgi:hypothetical protein